MADNKKNKELKEGSRVYKFSPNDVSTLRYFQAKMQDDDAVYTESDYEGALDFVNKIVSNLF